MDHAEKWVEENVAFLTQMGFRMTNLPVNYRVGLVVRVPERIVLATR
jgi:hypothetical protein